MNQHGLSRVVISGAPGARLPVSAAWRHEDARAGFEVVFPCTLEDGHRFEGDCAAVEAGEPWAIRYEIIVDPRWVTRRAEVTGLSSRGVRGVTLDHDGAGRWLVDGAPAAHLDGCLDVDLEASAFTNALPVNRLGLEVGESAKAPAAWVRALDLGIEPLAQRYRRLEDGGGEARYAYEAPALGFAAELRYDGLGLGTDYPGVAVRVL